MTDQYRIADRENIHMGGHPVTAFALFERQPHPIQGGAYEYVGRYMAPGHDASRDACIRAALASIHDEEVWRVG